MHHEKYYIGDQNCVCVKWHKIKSRKKLMKFLLLLKRGIKTSTWGGRHWSRICVRLPSCGPGFESDAFSINSHIFNSNCHCVEKKTRIIKKRSGSDIFLKKQHHEKYRNCEWAHQVYRVHEQQHLSKSENIPFLMFLLPRPELGQELERIPQNFSAPT